MLQEFDRNKINLGVYVRDKITGKDAVVSGLYDDEDDGLFIYIKFSPREPDHERREEDLEIHVWSQEEIDEVKERANTWKELLKEE